MVYERTAKILLLIRLIAARAILKMMLSMEFVTKPFFKSLVFFSSSPWCKKYMCMQKL